MAFDGIVTHAVTHELNERLASGRIMKIHQPTDTDIVMQIRTRNGNVRLLLSASLSFPRMHITNENYRNPLEAPMFCMLLRKYCEGAIIDGIHQIDMERIIHLDIRGRDELGDARTKRIVLEIMGRHSNLILMDPQSGMIHDGLHHVTPAVSRYRTVLPGRPYVAPPPQRKINPLVATKDDFIRRIRFNEGKIAKQIVGAFDGISPLIADEIMYRAGLPTQDSLWRAFAEITDLVKQQTYTPTFARTEHKEYFSAIPLTHLAHAVTETFTTISECLEAFYHGKAERDAVKQRMHDLARLVINERNKNEKKIEKLLETKQKAEDASKYQIYGELLTANLYQITRGQPEANVINYYEEEAPLLSIPLDPALTPSENAQAYFKRYTKAKNSRAFVDNQIAGAKEEILYLDTVLQQIENAGLADIEDIREELAEQGYLRARPSQGKKGNKQKNPTLERYTSSEGVTIYVGKNNKQNDYLTNRLANPDDTWLHTKDIPGSHVIIRGTEFGETTLMEAANLATYYSKARQSSQVPVDYTLVRHVRKPKGAKPGFVIYEQQKTQFVTPNDEIIRTLMKTKTTTS
ncbi:Rqc2 family fibronectin-binding protein [Aneurinibacillus aneurinilyticus]|jgi:predicted ribosome quality control (RQC) complex YloA/Tae2 family protein|nr:NFACT RNA binding domain-containing protein [Aneurinibacillus aneurinilyticus]MED0669245.1 NFACT RNA binding domain-containing protein [Aneurinibacillus aneurinilyticus]MED0707958.1 NFACT RNA binding domain-containing protein [Aneurinibacillus aneurinilyticus]MED0722371.1 NFACT RNA binding domain-containing protein [Aneurinibacillus aneurinilyticus]MED0734132.1 NFACT RNA binding domain-containing protein [Aneurinibacillus aneurinilyticus]MED0742245.1 NFACT RNA binding domain-containing prot